MFDDLYHRKLDPKCFKNADVTLIWGKMGRPPN